MLTEVMLHGNLNDKEKYIFYLFSDYQGYNQQQAKPDDFSKILI